LFQFVKAEFAGKLEIEVRQLAEKNGSCAIRERSIDLIKVIAIIGVVTIHACAGGFSYAVGSFNWVASLFFGSLTRASVPLFLMCSGALMLDPNRELSMKKLYTKNYLRLLAALFFWAAAYKVFHLLVGRALSAENIVQALTEVLLFRHESHLYYLHIILLVYAFLPVNRLFVKYSDKRLLEYALSLWFVLGIVYPTVTPFPPFSLLSGIPDQWSINMTYASIGYGLLGYYLKMYPLSRKFVYPLIGVIGFAFVFAGTWLMSASQNGLYQHFLEGMTLGVALLAIGIFGSCTAIPVHAGESDFLTFGSKSSFCIYLVHMFFLMIFSSVGFTVNIFPCLISIPLIVIANLICSGCVYLALTKLPVVNKWLI